MPYRGEIFISYHNFVIMIKMYFDREVYISNISIHIYNLSADIYILFDLDIYLIYDILNDWYIIN